MNIFYNAGIGLYRMAARVAAMRMPKARKMLQGQKQTLEQPKPGPYDVWVHAASLGEFEQARPLIERLRREKPELRILLTFFSPSGYEVRQRYDKVDAVAYLPFDTPGLVRRFLDTYQPRMAIFVKYEFWGNYLQQLQKRGVPTYIISAIFRPGQAFFRWWGGAMRSLLRCYRTLYLQDEGSRQLLASVGVDNAVVAGDTRFDRVTDVMRATVSFPAIEQWIGQGRCIVAGSSWQPDEERYLPWLNAHPDVKAIIAPHEFDAERIAALQRAIKGKSQTMSATDKAGSIDPDTQVLIVDSFGKLSSLYRYGSAAIIGGGFGAGIHNINEAAVYGMPVAFGPNHHKFKEAGDLIACGGGKEYATASDIATILDSWLAPTEEAQAALAAAGAAAGNYIRAHLGATDKIYADLFG